MKKWIIFLSVLFLLSGCTPGQETDASTTGSTTTAPTTHSTTASTEATGQSEPAPITFTLYVPNETVDGYITSEMTVDTLDPHLILQCLQDAGAIGPDAAVLSATVDGGNMLTLDMNAAFRDELCSMGSSGETMMMGSLVNTFLSAYGCPSMMVLAEGEIIHSGHVDYDFPMTPSI